MNQGHLFDNSISVGIDVARHAPVAARNDPMTSHQAAREVTASGKREIQLKQVLDLVGRKPGKTSFELAAFGKLDRYAVARRLPELEHGGLVMKTAARTCSISGRKAVTWRTL